MQEKLPLNYVTDWQTRHWGKEERPQRSSYYQRWWKTFRALHKYTEKYPLPSPGSDHWQQIQTGLWWRNGWVFFRQTSWCFFTSVELLSNGKASCTAKFVWRHCSSKNLPSGELTNIKWNHAAGQTTLNTETLRKIWKCWILDLWTMWKSAERKDDITTTQMYRGWRDTSQ